MKDEHTNVTFKGVLCFSHWRCKGGAGKRQYKHRGDWQQYSHHVRISRKTVSLERRLRADFYSGEENSPLGGAFSANFPCTREVVSA